MGLLRILLALAIVVSVFMAWAMFSTEHPIMGWGFVIMALDLICTVAGKPLFKPSHWARFAFGARKDDGWL